MKPRTPTFDETLQVARRAAEEIRHDWPDWKRALSFPARPVDDPPSASVPQDVRSPSRDARGSS